MHGSVISVSLHFIYNFNNVVIKNSAVADTCHDVVKIKKLKTFII